MSLYQMFRTLTWSALFAVVAGAVAQAGGDPAKLAPSDSMLMIGWTELNAGENEFVKLAQAVVNSPLVRRETDEEIGALARALEFAAAASRHAGAIWLMPGEKGGALPVTAGLVVSAGKDAATLSGLFTATGKAIPDVKGVETATIDGVSLSHATDADGDTVYWGVQKEHFIAAVGEAAAKRAVAHVNGGQSLADSPELALCRKKVNGGAKGWSLQVYGDLAGGIELLKENIGSDAPFDVQKACTALGLSAFKSMYIVFDGTDAGARLSAFMHADGKAGGLMKLWDQHPLGDDDIAIIPANAYWAQAWNFDLAAVWKEGMAAAEQISPDAKPAIVGVIAIASKFLGFNPVEQLLPALGESWAIYDAPAHAGLLFTGIVVVNEVRDADAITAAMMRVIEIATPFAEQAKLTLYQRDAVIDGQRVTYVTIGGLPIPVAPAWGVTNNRFVFGLFPQTVAQALKQANPKARGPSLLDNAEFKKTRGLLAKSLTSVSYCDSRYFEQTYYALMQLVHTAVASLSAGSKPSIDVAAMPTFPKHMESVRNALGGYSFDQDGVLYTGYGSTPVTFFVSGDASVASTALVVSILLPSLSRARELSKRAVCAANLRGIGQGFHIQANNQQEQFPESFDVLVKEGICTAQQFMCPSSGISPADVAAALSGKGGRLSYVYIAGQTTAADVSNVMAYEPLENHESEGGNVLFLDGHVEFLKPPRYQEVIRETYKRLKRESEMPGEFRGE